MASTYTANLNLEEPARGDQVGTWDTPVNANMTLIDLVSGGISAIALAGAGVVLASAQYQCRQLSLSSTLTASVALTFPTSFKKSYDIENLCTGSSAFVITLKTTAAGGQIIAVPFGETIEVVNDGTNLKFKSLARIGSYWDYCGSSVPAWVTNCTVPPYLNCDGTTFSSATYPQLKTILGSSILPDRRGTTGYTLNQGTARLTTASGGLDANTLKAIKTTTTQTIATGHLPAYTPTGTVSGTAAISQVGANVSAGGTTLYSPSGTSTASLPLTATFTGVAQGGLGTPLPVIGTGTVYGICMVRAG